MKKIILALAVVSLSLGLFACSSKPTLYVLNWGEYINEDVVDAFKEMYNVNVKIDIAESNELMEEKITNGATAYDIVIPSDYMIEKLYDGGYLQKIDLTKLTNYSEAAFMDGLNIVLEGMFTDNPEITSAYEVSIPYFWGVFGIMYNKNLAGLQAYIEANGWASLFEPVPANTFSREASVGMYDAYRFAYSLSLIYAYEKGLTTDPDAFNVASAENLALSRQILEGFEYDVWANDLMKRNVVAGQLDYCFTYVGDFFDQYLVLAEDATTAEEARTATSGIGIFVPDRTIAFYDGMVIPTNARSVDLAHSFIDFFLDPMNAYENSGIVGYTTTLQATYLMILNATEGDIIRSVMVSENPYNPSGANFAAKPLIAFSNSFTGDLESMVISVIAGYN